MEIQCRNVEKYYLTGSNVVKALRGISCKFKSGKMSVIIGPSGSGKTTLLNLIGSLDVPTKGEIIVNGEKISRMSKRERNAYRRENIGFVFQRFNLIPYLTVLENIILPAYLAKKGTKRELVDKSVEILEKLGITNKAGKMPNELSGGEQQRVAIARALLMSPKILLADEPTGELDHESGRTIIEILKKIADEGKIVIVATHDREISRIADEIVELRDGRWVKG